MVACVLYEFRFKINQIEYMNRDSTSALQGIAAIVVVLHHLSQQGISSFFSIWLLESGKYAVAIFFLISGYGVTYSTIYKRDYMKYFAPNKLRRLVIPYIFVTGIYYFTYELLGRDMTLKSVIENFVYAGRPIIENSWYVLVIILLYFSYYFLYNKTKKIDRVLVGIFGVCFLMIVLIRYLMHWQEYWYNATLCFPIGMAICLYSNIIRKILEKHYWLILCISLMLEIAILFVKKMGVKSIWIEIIGLILFVICIFILIMKIEYKGCIWKKISTISLELYLVHRLVYTVLRSEMVYIKSDLLFVFFTLVISIIVAYILKKIEDRIYYIIKKKRVLIDS